VEAFILVAVLIVSVVVHEVAHAWQARREGDDLAERLGRITLNPIPHLDPIGSVIVPLALHFTGTGFIFGWAKPVPVNPGAYRSPVWGDVRVSLAGIVSNLVLAALATIVAAVVVKIQSVTGFSGASLEYLFLALEYGIVINLLLAFFNLIPIPPLDGSHVLYHLLPPRLALAYREAGKYGLLMVMGLLFFFPGFFRLLLGPVFYFRGLADSFIRLWI
jgi:Zn-dependent protease